MKKILMLFAAMVALAGGVSAQGFDDRELFRQLGFPELRDNRKGNESILQKDDSTIFSDVDDDPQFPGGMDSVRAWITRHMDWSLFRECDITGKVIVAFIVETDGAITDVVKLRDIGCHVGDEVVKAVGMMPKWIPGKLNGNVVRVRYVLPYAFIRWSAYEQRKEGNTTQSQTINTLRQ